MKMMKSRREITDLIVGVGVVAVIRAGSKDQLADIAEALLAGGVGAIEVTMTTPDAIAGIQMLADKFADNPAAVIGVGHRAERPLREQ